MYNRFSEKIETLKKQMLKEIIICVGWTSIATDTPGQIQGRPATFQVKVWHHETISVTPTTFGHTSFTCADGLTFSYASLSLQDIALIADHLLYVYDTRHQPTTI